MNGTVHMWRSEDIFGSWFSPPTKFVPEIEFEPSGLVAVAFTAGPPFWNQAQLLNLYIETYISIQYNSKIR